MGWRGLGERQGFTIWWIKKEEEEEEEGEVVEKDPIAKNQAQMGKCLGKVRWLPGESRPKVEAASLQTGCLSSARLVILPSFLGHW